MGEAGRAGLCRLGFEHGCRCGGILRNEADLSFPTRLAADRAWPASTELRLRGFEPCRIGRGRITEFHDVFRRLSCGRKRCLFSEAFPCISDVPCLFQ
jgi:hypothetical protein